MAEQTTANEYKEHIKGEAVPVIVNVFSETESEFFVIPTKSTCEIHKSDGTLIESIPVVRIKDNEPNDKNLYANWDTSKGEYQAGYYLIYFWVAISFLGDLDANGEMVQDAKILSPPIRKCLKASL